MKSYVVVIAASVFASILTSQGYAQWAVHNSGIPTDDQIVLAAVNDTVCWGVTRATGARYVTKTTNGGVSWVASNHDSLSPFVSIAATGVNTAWIASEAAIYTTTNGGSNWARQLATGTMLIVRFFDSNNGVCIGDGANGSAEIYTTINKGTTWNPVESANIPPLVAEGFIPDNAFVRGNTIWVPTNGGSLYKSTDRGLNWGVVRSVVGIGGSFCAFRDPQNGLLSGSLAGTVKRTSDGGASWTPTESMPQGISTLFMSYIPGTNGSYMITSGTSHGPSTGSAYTLDNGATWATVDHALHGKAAFVSPSVGWSWGGADTIYKWTGPDLPVHGESSQLKNRFELSQNYPNPFNPTTEIRYQVPGASLVTLKVFDMLGSEVSTLVNEWKPAGSFTVKFNATGLASGVYLYKLEAKDFLSTKKLILLR